MRHIITAFFLLLYTGCATVPPVKAPEVYTVEGKTRYRQQGLTAGQIIALRAEPGGTVYTADIGKDGNFSFHLDAGAYFLMGRARDPESGLELFSYWSNNPLQVYGDMKDAIVMPFVVSTGLPEASAGRGIRGHVLFGGKLVEGAVVAAYLDAAGQFRGQPYMESAPTGAAGEYYLDVPPGRFFILARYRKKPGSYQGPLLKGDLSGFLPIQPGHPQDG